MQIHNSEALVDTYATTATKTRNALAALSPLVSEALALLEQPGQNPVYGPMPALQTVATELTKDERDLAWRVDWIKTTDAQPIGTTGRVTAYAPTTGGPNGTFDLDAALTASGLTTAGQQQAKEAILGGEDFTDAIDAERKRTLDDNMAAFRRQEAESWGTSPAAELARLNEEIANWNGTDNDPKLDALVRERDQLLERQRTFNDNMIPTLAFADDPDAAQDGLRLADLNEQIDNWAGTDNDQKLDDLVRERNELLVLLTGAQNPWDVDPNLAAEAALAGISYEQAVLESETAHVTDLFAQVDGWTGHPNDQSFLDMQDELRTEAERLSGGDPDVTRVLMASLGSGIPAIWALPAAQTQVQQDRERERQEDLANEVLEEVQALLHIDDQSGWTPWHDGKAEVSPQDAIEVIEILDALPQQAQIMAIDLLSEEELNRLRAAVDGDATHADKPIGHWLWSPIQVPVREIKVGLDDAALAGTDFAEGFTEGFAAMASHQGGPSQYSPYTAASTEQHFRDGAQVVLEGQIPIASNAARCVDGDGWSCAALGGEVVLWVAGELVGGIIVGAVFRSGSRAFARVQLRNGTERVVELLDDKIDDVTGSEFGDAPLRMVDQELVPRPSASQPSSTLSRSGGLAAHEANGGHTIARHVGKTPTELSDRLANSSVPAASSFKDLDTAESVIAAAIDANETQIRTWLANGAKIHESAFTYHSHEVVGISHVRGAAQAADVNTVRIVLRPDPTMPDGYRILTAFPE